MVPKWVQKWFNNGPKMGSKMVKNGPLMVQKGPKGQILGVPDSTRIPDFNSLGSLERSRISRVTSGNTENASEF